MERRGRVIMLLHPECDNVLLSVTPADSARPHLRDHSTLERRRSEHRKTLQKTKEQAALCNITTTLSPLTGESRRTYKHQAAGGRARVISRETFTEFPPQRAHCTLNQGNFVTGVQEGAGHTFRRKDLAYPTHGLVYCLSPQSEAFARCLRRYPERGGPVSLEPGAHSRELIAKLVARNRRTCSRKSLGRKSIHSLPDKKCLGLSLQTNVSSRTSGGKKQVFITTERESKSASSARDKDRKMGDDIPAGPRAYQRRVRGKWSSLVSDTTNVKNPCDELSANYEYLPRPALLVAPVQIPAPSRAPTPARRPASARTAASTKAPSSPRASRRAVTSTKAPSSPRPSSRAATVTKDSASPDTHGTAPARAPVSTAAPAAAAKPSIAPMLSLAPQALRTQTDNVVNQLHQINPHVFQLCPTLRTRFLQHKQDCPLRETDSYVSIDSEHEGSAPLFCRLLQYLTCESDQPSKAPTPSQDNRYCPCSKFPKCTCTPRPHNPRCEWYPNRIPLICPCKKKEDIYYSKKVYDAISKWLSNIPVPPNECPENNNLRLELAEMLAAEILRLPADDDYENNVRAAIEKCIDKIPMWTPDSKQDKQHLKKYLLESLLDEITEIPRHPNLLKERVKNFIDSLNVRDDIDKKAIVDDIVKTLTFLGAHAHDPLYDTKFTDLLISEIVEKLEEIPLEFDGDRNVILLSLAKNLANDVENLLKHIDVIADEEKDHQKNIENKIKKDVADWLNSFRELCGKLQNDADLKKIERDLTTKLIKLYSEGATENKIENEIDKAVQNFGIDPKLWPKIITSLMNKLTDSIYVEEKRMQDDALQKKTFGEIKNWLSHIQGVKDLDVSKQYKLIKDLTDKIKNKKHERTTDYRNDVVESLKNAGFNVNPASIQKELDDLVNIIHGLPEQVQRDELNKEIRKKLMDSLNNNPNIPKETNLVNELNDVLSQIMKTSPVSTQKDIENVKEKLLEHMNDRLQSVPVNESTKATFREELANILDKDFNKLKEQKAKNKDAVKELVLKEINYGLNEEPISADAKEFLKNAIKSVINEKLANPFSHHIIKTIHEEIEDLINENDLEDKKEMSEKLKQIVSKLDDLPKESLTAYARNNLIKYIDAEINKRNIIDNVKNDLKQKIKNIIKNNFNQAYTSNVKFDILDDVNEAIENSILPVSKKDSLMNTITSVTTEILDKLPKQTVADYVKDAITDEIYENRDDIILQQEEFKNFMSNIKTAIGDALDRPYTEQEKIKLQKTINDIIDKSNIPSDKKAKIANKMLDIVSHHLEYLPYQTNQSYAKEELMRYANKDLEDLELPSEEKEKLIANLEEKIEESIGDDLRKNKKVLEEAVEKVILESEIPPAKQDTLLSNLKAQGANILEESFYPDDVLDYLSEADKNINKSGLSEEEKLELKSTLRKRLDDISQEPDFLNKTYDITQELGLNQLPPGPQDIDIKDKIQKVTNAVKGISLPSNKKNILLNKINEKADGIRDDKDFSKLVKDLQKFIEELPLTSKDKKALEIKLDMIADPKSKEVQQKIKTNLMKNIEAAVDQIPIPEEKKEDVMKELQEILASESITTTSTAKERIKEGAQKVIDKNVFSKHKNLELKNEVADIVDNLLTHESDAKDEVIDVAFKTLDEGGFRPRVVEDLKSQIKDVIFRLFERPYEVDAKAKAMKDLKNVINNSRLTEYQKRTLEPKLAEQIKRKLKKLPGGVYIGGGVGDAVLKNLNDAIDELTIPKETKMEIKKNKNKIASESDLSSSEGKEMFRQKLLKNLDESTLPPEQKTHLTARIENEMRHYEVPTSSRIDLMNAIMKDIHGYIDATATIMPPIKKSLKKDINETVIENVNKKLPPAQIKDTVKSEISEIINKSPMPKTQKEELKTVLKKSVVENIQRDQEARKQAIDTEIRMPENKNKVESEETGSKRDKMMEGTARSESSGNTYNEVSQEKTPKKDEITVIDEWLNEQPIRLSDEVKDTLLNEITEDINERKEYLKMFPTAKKSDQDEWDNLQYQVMRRLKKVLNDKDMDQVMQATDALAKRMKEVRIEEATPGGQRRSSDSDQIKEGTAYPQELSPNAHLSFDRMKEELADAFFDLNFTGGTEEERANARKKITDQVYKFCDDYLQAHPGESLDSETLKLKLYEELQKALLLSDESISLEQTPQEIIHDLMKSLPPLDHLTCIERKNLEKEEKLFESKLREINRNEAGLTKDEIRKQKAISTKQFQQKVLSIIDNCQKKPRFGMICPDLRRLPICPPAGPCPGQFEQPLPCSLSAANRRHLELIRQRTCMEPECLSSLLKTCASTVCPRAQLESVASQTDEAVCPGILRSQECPYWRRAPAPPCPRATRLVSTPSNTEQIMTNSGVQCVSDRGIYPEVNVEEHQWEPLEPDEQGSGQQPRDVTMQREEMPPCRAPRDCIDMHPVCPSARRLRYCAIPQECTVPITKCKPRLSCPPVTCSKLRRPSPGRCPINLTFKPPTHSTPRHSINSYSTPEDRNNGRPERCNSQKNEFRSTIPSRHFGNERFLKLNEKLRCSDRISRCPELPDEETCEPPRCRWQEEAARPCYSRRRIDLPDYCNEDFIMNTGRRRCLGHCKRHSNSSVSFIDDIERSRRRNADLHCPFPCEGFFK